MLNRRILKQFLEFQLNKHFIGRVEVVGANKSEVICYLEYRGEKYVMSFVANYLKRVYLKDWEEEVLKTMTKILKEKKHYVEQKQICQVYS